MASVRQHSVSGKEENLLLEQGKRIRALHAIISRPDLDFDEQIDETLRLGCRILGTEVGKVGRQDPENNTSEFLNTIVLSDLPVKRGIVLPLDKTFCQVTFASPEAIAISHVSESEYSDHPAAAFLGVESYIGCSINVHGRKFGTVNFSNLKPVSHPFTEADKDFVNLIGSWISVMMERQLEAEDLRQSRQAAIEANRAKSSFLANMSHEIRTPLTTIIGFAETALDDDQTDAERIEALKTIRKSSDHLLNLINDVLDFSKIESGSMDIEQTSVNPVQLLAEVESIINGHAINKQLEFSCDLHYPLPARIQSDPLRLKQILLNLCSNAIKFTDEGSVRVVLEYDQFRGTLIFSVRDTGIGLSRSQVKSLFKPFKQADASISRRFGGTGLGLSLSKRLAQMLDGTLEARSKPEVGSVFSLALNLKQYDDEPIELLHSGSQAGTKDYSKPFSQQKAKFQGQVLVAEDNPLNQELIMRMLSRTGLNVSVVENGAAAIAMIEQHHYDLVLMDMQMPVLSGLEAVSLLRENGYSQPVVFLTANATREDRDRCTEAGANDFLTKPINREHMYRIIGQYLRTADTSGKSGS